MDTPISGSSRRFNDSMKPLVSILIPAYNAEPWIAETIRSAIGRHGPTRRSSWSMMDPLIRHYLLFKVCFQNGICCYSGEPGRVRGKKQAYELCQGDYIQWLDADDLLSPDKVAKQMGVAEQSQSKQTLLSSAWGFFIFRTSKARFVPTSLWCDLSPIEGCSADGRRTSI